MAKKKTPAAAAPKKKPLDVQQPHTESKIESLKTLNHLLVKETMERREQLGQLQARMDLLSAEHALLSALESDVTRLVISSRLSELERVNCDAERAARELHVLSAEKAEADGRAGLLRSRVSSLSDALGDCEHRLGKALEEKLEVEKALNVTLRERDAGRMDLNMKARRVEDLEVRVQELEIANAEIKEAVEKAMQEREWLAEEGKRRKEYARSLLLGKSSLERRLMDSEQLVKQTERKMEDLMRMKQEEVEFMKAEGEAKAAVLLALEEEHGCVKEAIHRLEAELTGSREEIYSLKKEREGMELEISRMGKSIVEAQEELEKLRVHLGVVEKEKEEMEVLFQSKMRESARKIDDFIGRVRETSAEKEQLEREKAKLEAEFFGLQKEKEKLLLTVLELQESCRNKDEENNQLRADRECVQRELDDQRKDVHTLRLQLGEALKGKDEAEEEVGRLKPMLNRLGSENEERERQFKLLTAEKAFLDKSLSAAKSGLEDLGRKVRAAKIFSVRALFLLKSTAEMMNGSLEDQENVVPREIGSDVAIDEEIEPFAAELEAIKKVFKSKTGKIEALSQELESLQCVITEEQKKKKGFWTWLYPATTTVLAAVSIAYAAKAH